VLSEYREKISFEIALVVVMAKSGLLIAVQMIRHFTFALPESGARPYEPTLIHHFFAYFPLFHLPTFIFGMALGKVFLSFPARTLRFRFHNMILLLSLGIFRRLFINHGKIDPIFLSDTVMVPLFGVIVFFSAITTGSLSRI